MSSHCEHIRRCVAHFHRHVEGRRSEKRASAGRRGSALGTEGQELEAIYHHCEDQHQAVKSKKLGRNRKADVLCSVKDAKDRRDEFYDPNHQETIQMREQIRSTLWDTHFKSPTAALAKARWSVWNSMRVNLLRQVSGDLRFWFVFARARNLAKTPREICNKFGKDLVGRNMALSGAVGDASDGEPMECSQ